MKNINYEPRTTKYWILLPIFIILSWIDLYFYRIFSWISGRFSAFVEIEFWIISPLILIFWWIVFFFIVLWAQQWENKMDKLNEDEKQKELRNKVIRDFRNQESREKKHLIFYIAVWILSLTAYVLTASKNGDGSYSLAKDLIFLLILWILILTTQAIRLWKFAKHSKLQKLKIEGKSIQGKILEITKKWTWFLRDDTMRYQILALSDETQEKYRSFKTRFDISVFLEKGDKILIYIDGNNSKKYFVDIESAFLFKDK